MKQWNLDALYTSYDDAQYQEDWQAIAAMKADFANLQPEDSVEGVCEVIDLFEKFRVLAQKLGAYTRLRLSVNTSDSEATDKRDQFARLMTSFNKDQTRLERFLGASTVDPAAHEELKPYEYAIRRIRQLDQYVLSDEVEEAISTMNLTAGQGWNALFSFLTSDVQTDFHGKTYTLSEIRNLAYANDAEVRKGAYEAELAMYDQIKESIAFALNNIKGQVRNLADLRGFEGPLDETLINSRMDQATLDALLGSIKKYLPEFQRFLKAKAKMLGHSKGLPFYDLFAPVGTVERKLTIDESRSYLVDQFRPFADDLADLVEKAYDDAWMDFTPRKGKVGGAFCSNLPPIKQSRILLNYDGSLSSVVTTAHELGHAYHGLFMQEHRPFNWGYTMPVAETASTFNEVVVMNALIHDAKDEAEELVLLEQMLTDLTQIIVDIYSRYLFEYSVFEDGEKGFLFSKQLEERMLEAQKEAYGEGLDSDYLHPYMWVCKPHYYSTGLSFYNFPYAFGGLFARAIYDDYKKQPAGFLEKYQDFLRETSVASVEDATAVMGFDVREQAFWDSVMENVIPQIDRFVELSEK